VNNETREYNLGFDAGVKGWRRSQNPFTAESTAFEDWDDGWEHGMETIEMEERRAEQRAIRNHKG